MICELNRNSLIIDFKHFSAIRRWQNLAVMRYRTQFDGRLGSLARESASIHVQISDQLIHNPLKFQHNKKYALN